MELLHVNHIFGMPGAHILPVYDALYRSSIKSVLAKHEQGAAFMACGYSKAAHLHNGRQQAISACITTAGPGATNLVTGIANAYVDKQPILIITGETSTHIFGKGGLQESAGEGGSISQVDIFRGITRYSRVIERTDYLVNCLNRATRELYSDTPGPVLLSIPFNIQLEDVDDSCLQQLLVPEYIHRRYGAQSQHDMSQVLELIEAAKYPVVLSGYGCLKSNSSSLVKEFAEKLNIPVTSSLKGKGALQEDHPLSLGSLGVTSYSHASEYIMNYADLIIILGATFNERTSYLWKQDLLANKKIIQVDIDASQLNKVFIADVSVNADLHQYLSALNSEISARNIRSKSDEKLRFVRENLVDTKSKTDLETFSDKFSNVSHLFDYLNKIEVEHQIFDDNIIFAQNFLNVRDNCHYYSNSGVSSLGHAIPAAIGARMSNDMPAFVIIGDGGFQMCCMEIMTAVNYKTPITIIMFNNSTMGLIRKNQFQKYEKRYIDCDFINPDYQSLCDAFGIEYYAIRNNSDIESVFDKIDYKNSISLIDVYIDKDLFPDYVTSR